MDGEKQRAQPRRELQAGQSHMCRVVPTYGSQSIVRRLHAARQRGQSWSQRVPALTRLSLNFAPNREHERFINTVKPLFMDPSIISEPERHEEVSVSSASRSVCVWVGGGKQKERGRDGEGRAKERKGKRRKGEEREKSREREPLSPPELTLDALTHTHSLTRTCSLVLALVAVPQSAFEDLMNLLEAEKATGIPPELPLGYQVTLARTGIDECLRHFVKEFPRSTLENPLSSEVLRFLDVACEVLRGLVQACDRVRANFWRDGDAITALLEHISETRILGPVLALLEDVLAHRPHTFPLYTVPSFFDALNHLVSTNPMGPAVVCRLVAEHVFMFDGADAAMLMSNLVVAKHTPRAYRKRVAELNLRALMERGGTFLACIANILSSDERTGLLPVCGTVYNVVQCLDNIRLQSNLFEDIREFVLMEDLVEGDRPAREVVFSDPEGIGYGGGSAVPPAQNDETYRLMATMEDRLLSAFDEGEEDDLHDHHDHDHDHDHDHHDHDHHGHRDHYDHYDHYTRGGDEDGGDGGNTGSDDSDSDNSSSGGGSHGRLGERGVPDYGDLDQQLEFDVSRIVAGPNGETMLFVESYTDQFDVTDDSSYAGSDFDSDGWEVIEEVDTDDDLDTDMELVLENDHTDSSDDDEHVEEGEGAREGAASGEDEPDRERQRSQPRQGERAEGSQARQGSASAHATSNSNRNRDDDEQAMASELDESDVIDERASGVTFEAVSPPYGDVYDGPDSPGDDVPLDMDMDDFAMAVHDRAKEFSLTMRRPNGNNNNNNDNNNNDNNNNNNNNDNNNNNNTKARTCFTNKRRPAQPYKPASQLQLYISFFFVVVVVKRVGVEKHRGQEAYRPRKCASRHQQREKKKRARATTCQGGNW